MSRPEEVSAQVAKVIHTTPPMLWMALTTPATLKQFFFGADVVTDWKVGSLIRMKGEFEGRPYEDKGNVLVAERLQRLSFSHWSPLAGKADIPENYHVVTFDLVPDGDWTTVTLTQSNLIGGVTESDRAHRAEYEKNWSMVLDGLSKLFP